jgi:hypothetical protein
MRLLIYGLFNSAVSNLVNQVLNDWMISLMIWRGEIMEYFGIGQCQHVSGGNEEYHENPWAG